MYIHGNAVFFYLFLWSLSIELDNVNVCMKLEKEKCIMGSEKEILHFIDVHLFDTSCIPFVSGFLFFHACWLHVKKYSSGIGTEISPPCFSVSVWARLLVVLMVNDSVSYLWLIIDYRLQYLLYIQAPDIHIRI